MKGFTRKDKKELVVYINQHFKTTKNFESLEQEVAALKKVSAMVENPFITEKIKSCQAEMKIVEESLEHIYQEDFVWEGSSDEISEYSGWIHNRFGDHFVPEPNSYFSTGDSLYQFIITEARSRNVKVVAGYHYRKDFWKNMQEGDDPANNRLYDYSLMFACKKGNTVHYRSLPFKREGNPYSYREYKDEVYKTLEEIIKPAE